jgi:hypothetical protein
MVHLGNKAMCCDGSELVSGAVGDQVTYCYKITNTGDTYLKNFEIVDPDCKPSALPQDNLDGTLLPPNQSKWVRYLTTIPDGGVTSSGKVEAEAAFYTRVLIDAEHGGGTVTAEDPAGVAEGTSEPTVAPAELTVFNEEPECPADVKLVSSVGETSFGNFPITIVSQDTSSVTFEVKGSWQTEIAYLYAQFPSVDRSEDCFTYETINAAFSEQITAKCMEKVPISIVSIVISGSSLSVEKDNAEVPNCCQAPEQDTFPVAKYTFQIWCVPQCPDAEA